MDPTFWCAIVRSLVRKQEKRRQQTDRGANESDKREATSSGHMSPNRIEPDECDYDRTTCANQDEVDPIDQGLFRGQIRRQIMVRTGDRSDNLKKEQCSGYGQQYETEARRPAFAGARANQIRRTLGQNRTDRASPTL
jgi:hypothetical protein